VGRDRAPHDPGIPEHKEREVALVTAGVEYDVLGFGFDEISPEDRKAVLAAYPRIDFKEAIIQAFADGVADKPHTTFGTVNADVLAEKLPGYVRPTSARSSAAQAQHLILLQPRPTRTIARGDQALANRFRRPRSLTVVSARWLSSEPRTRRGCQLPATSIR
jgi:hypothetical protein